MFEPFEFCLGLTDALKAYQGHEWEEGFNLLLGWKKGLWKTSVYDVNQYYLITISSTLTTSRHQHHSLLHS